MGILKKSSIIGLDIGSSSVKVACFVKNEKGLELVKTAQKKLNTGLDNESQEEEILKALKELLKGINTKASKIIVTINCPKTCIRIFNAPYMPKKELSDGIKLTAKSFFPFPIDNAVLDFEILDEVLEKNVKKYRLLVATSPKETVNRYLALLGKLGIKPDIFIPAPLALQSIIEKLQPKDDEIKAVLDLGARFSELAIFSGSKLIFSRKIPVTGMDFTKAMTGVLVSDMGKTALSLEEAERIKCELGVPLESDVRTIENKISTIQILSMLRPLIEQLASEIDRCFDYYREETSGSRIDSLVLFGGGAKFKGLSEFLSRELSMTVEEDDSATSAFSLAIGAGMSLERKLNLLPEEFKEKTKKTVKRAAIFAVSTAVVFTMLLTYIGMNIQFDIFKRRAAISKMEYQSLLPQVKTAEIYAMAKEVLRDEPYWEDIFKEIGNVIPRDMYLVGLSAKKGAIKMKGIVESEEGEEILSDFIFILEKGIFKNVKLVKTRDVLGNQTSFEIKCRVD